MPQVTRQEVDSVTVLHKRWGVVGLTTPPNIHSFPRGKGYSRSLRARLERGIPLNSHCTCAAPSLTHPRTWAGGRGLDCLSQITGEVDRGQGTFARPAPGTLQPDHATLPPRVPAHLRDRFAPAGVQWSEEASQRPVQQLGPQLACTPPPTPHSCQALQPQLCFKREESLGVRGTGPSCWERNNTALPGAT